MRVRVVLAAAAALMASSCEDGLDSSEESVADDVELVANAASAEEAATAGMDYSADIEPPGSLLTGPQTNAVRSARQYLSMSGFSRAGLIEQLSSEYGDGYSIADATAAVDSLNVDWNENAARSGKQYLNMSGFSCSGLIEQLSSSAGDRYTEAQAAYGAKQAGAC